MKSPTATALITGASQGFGFAIAEALVQRGWRLIINARRAGPLREAQRHLQQYGEVIAIAGDVRDEILLLQLAEVLEREQWTLELVINNASTLGASPQPALLDYPTAALHDIYHTNVIAPLSLLQKVHSYLSGQPVVINLSSDAAVGHYAGWGGYGSSKAALDHWTAVLAEEQPEWHVYAFDPGDMRTTMHQDAFPGEDISDRPLPTTFAVPGLLNLLRLRPPSGRYTAQDQRLPAADPETPISDSLTLQK